MEGLSSFEAKIRLEKFGSNILPEENRNLVLCFISKLFSPVNILLECIILLQLFLQKYPESSVIGFLLIFNVTMSFAKETKASKALKLLKKRLEVRARVFRDGSWQIILAQNLVPGDLVRIRMGDFVPADLQLIDGSIFVDCSVITGESLPIEPKKQEVIYAGSIVTRGEANANVIATGKRTFYGKAAQIVQTTKTPSHLGTTIFSIVKYLLIFDFILVFFVSFYSYSIGISLSDLIPFSLLLLVASVPVALPATYSLATALGSMELARQGVLITKLSAIEEAAAMDLLCVDKTGTITKNELTISGLKAVSPFSEEDLLVLASFASEIATQDPIDLAIVKSVPHSRFSSCEKLHFIPFDPKRKCSEAIVRYQGSELHIVKGAFHRDDPMFQEMARGGARVITVLAGQELVGFISLQDLPRDDSRTFIAEIRDMGVGIQMMTGDAKITAEEIGKKVGLSSQEIISEVYPEDKFLLIKQFQQKGNITGMTGDGVNDAPALKQAEVGIAVSNATDVVKAAASIVLTSPGLEDILKAIQSSRRIYKRMLTYIQNKIVKTLEISILLCFGLVFYNEFIISQHLIVLLLFANDFITMSISTDRVSISPTPDKWNIQKLVFHSGVFTVFILGFSCSAVYVGKQVLHFSLDELQTWVFLLLVFTGQCTVYLIRELHRFWYSCPSLWMIGLSIIDVIIVCGMAVSGIWMTPISILLIITLLTSVILYFFLLDWFKAVFISLIADSKKFS